MGNWLNRSQAKELVSVPDRERLIGKRDHAILARLLGCGRQELAHLKVEDIVERERAAIVDLVGKGKARADRGPYWVKQGVGQWTCGAGIT